MDLNRLLTTVKQHGASDLHLQTGSAAMLRVHGQLAPLQTDPIEPQEMEELFKQIADEQARAALERDLNCDFAYMLEGVARFRVNAFRQLGQLAIAFRLIPVEVPTAEQLNLPSVVNDIAQAERGLVLVTGTTGSGKSSTLAAMIDFINRSSRKRIITIEDPIEFVHSSQKALVAQREVGPDATGFLPSLRAALRQDPDAILIGELRDLETMRTAIQAADTGHVVYSTVHTTTAAQTVQRLIALFPPNERDLLLMQLASNLEAVISQRLARKADESGRVPVVEVLRATPVVRKLIREGKPLSLPEAMVGGENGMMLFDQHLSQLYKDGVIKGREALRLATNPEAVGLAMRGISSGDMQAGLVR